MFASLMRRAKTTRCRYACNNARKGKADHMATEFCIGAAYNDVCSSARCSCKHTISSIYIYIYIFAPLENRTRVATYLHSCG